MTIFVVDINASILDDESKMVKMESKNRIFQAGYFQNYLFANPYIQTQMQVAGNNRFLLEWLAIKERLAVVLVSFCSSFRWWNLGSPCQLFIQQNLWSILHRNKRCIQIIWLALSRSSGVLGMAWWCCLHSSLANLFCTWPSVFKPIKW